MRLAQGTGPDETERHEDVRVNDQTVVDEQYWCNYEYAMELVSLGEAPPTSNWVVDNFADFMSRITANGVYGAANWQIVDRWGSAWTASQQNIPMEVYLNAGINTISARAEWGWTTLDYIELDVPPRATNPNPPDRGRAKTSQPELSWTNAVPNVHHVDVWFGETPEYDPLDPNSVITTENYKLLLGKLEDISHTKESAAMPPLENLQNYTWVVDGFLSANPEPDDPNNHLGVFWTFTANDNEPPEVDVGPDQYLWLGQDGDEDEATLVIDATATDDGLPPEVELTYLWEQVAGPEVTISPADVEDITLTLEELANNNEEGTAEPYQFRLTVSDSDLEGSDTVTVTLSTDSCLASHEIPDSYYHLGDVNQDCKVDINDFYEVALNWLACTNTLASCE
jgi:hypothetical protein